jgi:prepilin peptidase CpaA
MVDIILVSGLLISSITDLMTRKVLNLIVFPMTAFAVLHFGLTNGWSGFWFSIAGLLTGVALLIIPYLLGGIGAGDVKLLGMVGSFVGYKLVFASFLYMGLVGGLMALFVLVQKNGFRTILMQLYLFIIQKDKESFRQLCRTSPSYTLPYAVAIALGTFFAFMAGGFG